MFKIGTTKKKSKDDKSACLTKSATSFGSEILVKSSSYRTGTADPKNI